MKPGRRAAALLAGGLLAALGGGCAHAPPRLTPEVEARLTGTPGGYV
ncbi:hypothetical protein HPC49_36655, partial [Pyxidicoccus fallax]|nr:hypothetical protein [Pyxidicoccus fallax]